MAKFHFDRMYIANLAGFNFKGFSLKEFNFKLAPVTLIVGPNFGCKTSILDAITVGLLGYHPKLGKTNPSTYQLAGDDPEMKVNIGFSDNRSILQTWRQNAKGQVSKDGGVPDTMGVPPELLHIKDYLTRTALERVQFVFERIQLPEFNAVDLMQKLGGIEVLPMKIGAVVATRVVTKIQATYEVAMTTKKPVPQWLSSVIDTLKIEKRDADALAKVHGNTLTGLKKGAPPKVDDPSAELKRVEEVQRRLLQNKGAHDMQVQQYHKTEARRLQIKTKLEQMTFNAADIEVLRKDIEDLKAKAGEAKCEMCGAGRSSWTSETMLHTHPIDDDTIQSLSALQAQLEDMVHTKEERAHLERELAGLETYAPPAENAMELVKGELDRNAKELGEAQTKARAFNAHAAYRKQLEAAEESNIGYQVESEVLKKAIEIVVKTQADLVDSAFNKLLDKAKLFTDGILPANLQYRDGDLGFMRGNRFVTWGTFSGTEDLIASAALAIALCQDSPFKLVLLDEFGRLTASNKAKVLDRMVALVANGTIDQAVIVDALDEGFLTQVQPPVSVVRV